MTKLIMLLLAAVFFAAAPTHAAAPVETAGQILAKISKLPAEQRQQALMEKAKAEGDVAFYSSLQAQQIDPFTRVFQKAIR